MNICTSTAETCIPGQNWVCFAIQVKGYDSRPVKNPPLGPWWEDSHGLGHVSVVAYIPLRNTTLEGAEQLLRIWPNSIVIDNRVQDSILFKHRHPCPIWWKGDPLSSSCW